MSCASLHRLTQPQALSALAEESRRLRETHHLSQRQAALQLQIDQSTVSRIERGMLLNPGWLLINRFCTVFDVTPDCLMGLERATAKAGVCPKCGLAWVAGNLHSIRDCIMYMEDQGRRHAFISKQFDLTIRSIEFIIREEYRLRGVRASLLAAHLAKLMTSAT